MTRVTTMAPVRAALFFACAAALLAFVALAPRVADAAITSQLDVGSTGPDVVALQTYLAVDPTLYPEGLITATTAP